MGYHFPEPQSDIHKALIDAGFNPAEVMHFRGLIENAIENLICILDTLNDADLEPTLGAPENVDQTHWSDGDNRANADDCEDENEHGTDLDRGEGDTADDEPSLGSTDCIDQRKWCQGSCSDRERIDEDCIEEDVEDLPIEQRAANVAAAKTALAEVKAIARRKRSDCGETVLGQQGNLICIGTFGGHPVWAEFGGSVR